MELGKKLLEQGWYITDEGIKKVIAAASNGDGTEVNDVRKVISVIMNMDLREIGGGALPIKKDNSIPGRIVLQLQKTRNISAPKSNEESKTSPRFLQLELTDGQTTIHALELENISTLNMNLPPGTKIYFRSERLNLMQNFLILRSSELQVLGGRVEALVEKWELARTMLKYAKSGRRMSGANGPPPWIPFGKKLENSLSNERNFKSLQAAGSDGKETKENEEFNAMRNEAIAEASKTGSKKIFGGGGQQMLDHNVKKILEKGFSEEDAKQVLRTTNNNLERALYNLKRRGEVKRAEENGNESGNFRNTQAGTFISSKNNRGVPTREMGPGKRGGPLAKEDANVAKPAGNVSLFDFLTDKLPVDAGSNSNPVNSTFTTNIPDEPTKSNKFEKNKKEAYKPSGTEKKITESNVQTNSNTLHARFENTMSSSFAANRSTGQVNVRQRTDRGNINTRGGRSFNERLKNTPTFNPFKESGNDRNNENIRSSGCLSNINTNQGRNNRVSYERGKNSNTSNGDLPETEISNYANKRGNEKQQQQRNHGGAEYIGGNNENRSRLANKRENSNQHQNNNTDSKNSSATKSTARVNSNSSNTSQINKLIEDTSKLKISDLGRSPGNTTGEACSNLQISPNTPLNIGPSQQTNQIESSAQANDGYSYDTSKIIGFQNKKTNEFAMTLLKSQGLVSSKSALYAQLQQQPSSSRLQAPFQMNSYVSPTSDYSLPTPPTESTVAPIPSHFGMVQGDGWHWKIGDLCFAKYWDDGRYYEAEVTAVSEKTCVVFYLGYGNHEEVLKSDCLPITDGNHCPVNNYNSSLPYQQSLQGKSNAIAPIHLSQQVQQGAYQRGGAGTQRFRGERQMYVPPHKREN
ncbi:tudor domain-containing protein 3 [Bactrocera tryoni]|uniref:tudor domain-containing protein 3 n=1 Tax=Bactrocera tryoni TaxID=59916 RepID=UPI001A9923F9|nr:tudor domain-containing protein 3 [Bactrocera tryoni]